MAEILPPERTVQQTLPVAVPGALAPVPQRPRHKPHRHLALLILAGLAAAGAAAWFVWHPVPPATVLPRIGPAVTAVYASGSVEASVMLPVAPRVGARLVAIDADEHDQVKKGQLLGRLESEDLASNIAQLAANAASARQDLERNTRLMRENAIAPQAYDHSVATSRAADAALNQARAQAGFMKLVAPDNCQVIQRDGEVGQFIAANTPVFWLSCHANLRVSAQVDEEDIPLVKVGQPVLIRADAFPGQVFEAKVSEVTPKGDPIGRSYRVRIVLPADTPLKIGMTTESNIIARKVDHALLLPLTAVKDGRVWKMENGKPVRAAVRTGATGNDWVEIVSGLAPTDAVVRDASQASGP